jgi:SET domain-containing protein
MKNLIRVKQTAAKGLGVFATRDIRKDEVIAKFEGPMVVIKNLDEIPREVQDHLYNIDIDKYIIAKEPAARTNHSCEPNAGIKKDVYLVAMRDIKKDEEVTLDYSLITPNNWTLECQCGAKTCRKLIGRYQDLPDELKRKHKDYTPDWIKRL